jgi:hypothetical protein
MFYLAEPLKLRFFSAKEKKKVVILRRIAAQFEHGIRYSEKEVNAILMDILGGLRYTSALPDRIRFYAEKRTTAQNIG